jgi:hypothetical protein
MRIPEQAVPFGPGASRNTRVHDQAITEPSIPTTATKLTSALHDCDSSIETGAQVVNLFGGQRFSDGTVA